MGSPVPPTRVAHLSPFIGRQARARIVAAWSDASRRGLLSGNISAVCAACGLGGSFCRFRAERRRRRANAARSGARLCQYLRRVRPRVQGAAAAHGLARRRVPQGLPPRADNPPQPTVPPRALASLARSGPRFNGSPIARAGLGRRPGYLLRSQVRRGCRANTSPPGELKVRHPLHTLNPGHVAASRILHTSGPRRRRGIRGARRRRFVGAVAA
jgi:hypothetical protein